MENNDGDDSQLDENEDNQNIPKKRKLSPQKTATIDEDDTICTICFEDYQTSGDHRMSSLKCGHVFGDKCIRRWIQEKTADQKFCPQCKMKAVVRDIRYIYANKIRTYDNSNEERLKIEIESLKTMSEKLKCENNYNLAMISQQKMEITRLIVENERLRNAVIVNTETAKAGIRIIKNCRIYLEKNLDFKDNPENRLMKYLSMPKKILISQKAPSSALFSGYGIKVIDFESYRAEKFIQTSGKCINDFCMDSNETFLTSASKDPVCQVYSIKTNSSVISFRSNTTPTVPFWSCSFDNDRPNYVLLGGQNGTIYKFDTRNASTIVNEFTNTDLKSPVKFIVPMKSNQIPRGGYFVVYIRGLIFYDEVSQSYTTLMTESIASLTYDHKTEMVLITKSPMGSGVDFVPTCHFLMKLIKDPRDPNSVPFLQEVSRFDGTASTMPSFSRPTQVKVPDGVVVTNYLQDTKMLQGRLHSTGRILCETPVIDPITDLCPIYENNNEMFGAVSSNRCRLYKLNLEY